jgi:hypothetical protein
VDRFAEYVLVICDSGHSEWCLHNRLILISDGSSILASVLVTGIEAETRITLVLSYTSEPDYFRKTSIFPCIYLAVNWFNLIWERTRRRRWRVRRDLLHFWTVRESWFKGIFLVCVLIVPNQKHKFCGWCNLMHQNCGGPTGHCSDSGLWTVKMFCPGSNLYSSAIGHKILGQRFKFGCPHQGIRGRDDLKLDLI